MGTVTIKRGDTHDLEFVVSGSVPVNLAGAIGEVHVRPRGGTTAQTFPAALAGSTATWTLDGSLAVGVYEIEIELTVAGRVITAPSDGFLRLVVLPDLA